MRCAPPRGNGQPPVCPQTPSTNPMAALKGDPSGSVECAAIPANKARARGPPKCDSASPRAGRIAAMPNLANSNGWRGSPSGASTSWRSCGHASASGSNSARQASPSRPRFAAVRSIERSSRTAVPSSSGCASGASGCTHSSPCAASGNCSKHGEHTAKGCTAEQISWTNPGSVNSADRAPPPIVCSAFVHRDRVTRARQHDSQRQGRWVPTRQPRREVLRDWSTPLL